MLERDVTDKAQHTETCILNFVFNTRGHHILFLYFELQLCLEAQFGGLRCGRLHVKQQQFMAMPLDGSFGVAATRQWGCSKGHLRLIGVTHNHDPN
jgi:hypothetical protein